MDREVASISDFSLRGVDRLHCAPDIEDLARRGGLPRAIAPYRLDTFNGRLFVEASGNSTATVSSCVIVGFGKDVHDARAFCRQFPECADPVLLSEKFRNLSWMSDQWLQNAIIDGREATDDEQLASELFLQLVEEVPTLRRWMPWILDDRPSLVKKGEIADTFQTELKMINEACKPKRKSLGELRNQFPVFSLWQFSFSKRCHAIPTTYTRTTARKIT